MLEGANRKVQVDPKPKAAPEVKKPEAPKPEFQFQPEQFTFALDKLYVAKKPVNTKVIQSLNFAGDDKTINSLSFEPNKNDTAQVQQLKKLGAKYKVPFKSGEDVSDYQMKVVKAVVLAKAKEHGIPEKVALGMSGLESGMKMWENIEGKKPEVISGENYRYIKDKKHPEAKPKKVLSSTDWGVMQINDKAHPSAFPKAKQDLEANIDYGMKYLAETRKDVKGSLKLGFGDWDRTIAAYNLGHDPNGKRDHKIARRYILAAKGALDLMTGT